MYSCEHPEVSQLYCSSTHLHCISEYKNISSHVLVKRFALNSELKLFECSQKLLRIVSGWQTNSFWLQFWQSMLICTLMVFIKFSARFSAWFTLMFKWSQQIGVVCWRERCCVLSISIGNHRLVYCEVFCIWSRAGMGSLLGSSSRVSPLEFPSSRAEFQGPIRTSWCNNVIPL